MSLLPPSPESQTPAADAYVLRIQESQATLQQELLKARKAMELSANRHRRPAPNLVPGQRVWLLRRHIATRRPSRKLDVRRLGPYEILESVGRSAYRLKLPPSMQIHPVFHVSLLEPHVENTFPGRDVPPPPPELVDSFEEFEVEKILDSRIHRGGVQYLVAWVGYDASENTWEPFCNLTNATSLLEDFHLNFPSRPRHSVPST